MDESIIQKNFKEGDNFICSLDKSGISIYAFKGEKPDEIDIHVLDALDQNVICSGKIYHSNGEIDCFSGNVNKNKIIMPIIKELEKHGYTYVK